MAKPNSHEYFVKAVDRTIDVKMYLGLALRTTAKIRPEGRFPPIGLTGAFFLLKGRLRPKT
jgi:hypothetical protein